MLLAVGSLLSLQFNTRFKGPCSPPHPPCLEYTTKFLDWTNHVFFGEITMVSMHHWYPCFGRHHRWSLFQGILSIVWKKSSVFIVLNACPYIPTMIESYKVDVRRALNVQYVLVFKSWQVNNYMMIDRLFATHVVGSAKMNLSMIWPFIRQQQQLKQHRMPFIN